MNSNVKILLLMFVALSTIGCSSGEVKNFDAALENGSDFELFSLDPSLLDKKELEGIRAESAESLFQKWRILGSTKITSQKTRTLLLKSLAKAEVENDRVAGCFNPRHGIRVTHEGKLCEYAICFECYQIYPYVDGVRGKYIKTTSTPASVFNKVLTDANVALPKN